MKAIKHLLLLPAILLVVVAQSQEISDKNYRLVTVKSSKLSEAPRKVYIKNFKVFYQMIAEAEKTVYGGRQLGGGSYTGNATARLAVGVQGVSPNDLQALTNQLYNNYINSLQEQGLEIMNVAQVGATEFFNDWDRIDGPRINQEQIVGSLMVVPDNFGYFVKGVSKKGKEKTGGFMAGVTGDAGGFQSSLYGPVPKLSDEIDDAIVVEVAISIPSIYLDPKSRLGTAKIKGGPYLRLGQAKISYISGKLSKPGVPSPKTAIELTLEKPVAINGVFDSQEFKAVATKSRTTVPDYAAFFTVENKTVELSNTIECDPQTYKSEVSKTINTLLAISIEKLAKGLQGEKVK